MYYFLFVGKHEAEGKYYEAQPIIDGDFGPVSFLLWSLYFHQPIDAFGDRSALTVLSTRPSSLWLIAALYLEMSQLIECLFLGILLQTADYLCVGADLRKLEELDAILSQETNKH